MRLCELFNNNKEMNVKEQLRQAVLDIITPLIANKVPFITVQAVIDGLSQARPGVLIDRSFVMDLMDPDKIKAVSKIEGDRIYLQVPGTENDFKASKNETQRQVDKIKGDAIKKAQKDVKAAK